MPHVERYQRSADGGWLLTEADSPEGVIELPSIGCRLNLAAIYDKVPFEPDQP